MVVSWARERFFFRDHSQTLPAKAIAKAVRRTEAMAPAADDGEARRAPELFPVAEMDATLPVGSNVWMSLEYEVDDRAVRLRVPPVAVGV